MVISKTAGAGRTIEETSLCCRNAMPLEKMGSFTSFALERDSTVHAAVARSRRLFTMMWMVLRNGVDGLDVLKNTPMKTNHLIFFSSLSCRMSDATLNQLLPESWV